MNHFEIILEWILVNLSDLWTILKWFWSKSQQIFCIPEPFWNDSGVNLSKCWWFVNHSEMIFKRILVICKSFGNDSQVNEGVTSSNWGWDIVVSFVIFASFSCEGVDGKSPFYQLRSLPQQVGLIFRDREGGLFI